MAEDAPTDLVSLGDVAAAMQGLGSTLEEADKLQADVHARSEQSSLDTERAFLGGILIGGIDVVDDVEEVGLSPSAFTRDAHGEIFAAILRLHSKRDPIDCLTVADELKRVDKLDKVGGTAALATLEGLIPASAHCPAYARMIFSDSRRRTLAKIGRIVTRRAERGTPWQEISDFAEAEIMALQNNTSNGLIELHESMARALSNHPGMGGVIPGEKTGFVDLDNALRLRGGEFIIIAARPSMGKTAFALDLFRFLSVRNQKPCAFFSLEMDGETLLQRQLAAQSGVPSRKKNLSPSDLQKMERAANSIISSPQFIDETPGISIGEIRAKSRALHRKHGLSAVFIDYLGLVKPPNESASRNQQIADISLALKTLARELRLPVICLSQLNRAVEIRPNKRPMMSDLRDSGAVEQDADIILFLYRDEYYYGPKASKPGVAEVIIGKNRNGPTDTIDLHFNPKLPRFDNLSRTNP